MRISAFSAAPMPAQIVNTSAPKRISAFSPTPTTNAGGFLGGAEYLGTSFLTGILSPFQDAAKFFTIGALDLFGQDELAEYHANREWAIDQWQREATEKYNPSEGMQLAGAVTGGIGQSLTQLGLAAIPVVGVPAAVTTLVTSGAGRGLQTYAQNTGSLDWKGYGYGLSVGALEATLEKFLGVGIKGGLGKLGTGKIASTVTGKFSTGSIKRTVAGVVGDALEEGLEESLSEVLDAPLQKLWQVNPEATIDWGAVLYAGTVGSLSGGLMSGVGSTAARLHDYRVGKKAIAKGQEQTIVNLMQKAMERYDTKGPNSKLQNEFFEYCKATLKAYNEVKGKGGDAAPMRLGQMKKQAAKLSALNVVQGQRTQIMEAAKQGGDAVKAWTGIGKAVFGFDITPEQLATNADIGGIGAADAVAILWFGGAMRAAYAADVNKRTKEALAAQAQSIQGGISQDAVRNAMPTQPGNAQGGQNPAQIQTNVTGGMETVTPQAQTAQETAGKDTRIEDRMRLEMFQGTDQEAGIIAELKRKYPEGDPFWKGESATNVSAESKQRILDAAREDVLPSGTPEPKAEKAMSAEEEEALLQAYRQFRQDEKQKAEAKQKEEALLAEEKAKEEAAKAEKQRQYDEARERAAAGREVKTQEHPLKQKATAVQEQIGEIRAEQEQQNAELKESRAEALQRRKERIHEKAEVETERANERIEKANEERRLAEKAEAEARQQEEEAARSRANELAEAKAWAQKQEQEAKAQAEKEARKKTPARLAPNQAERWAAYKEQVARDRKKLKQALGTKSEATVLAEMLDRYGAADAFWSPSAWPKAAQERFKAERNRRNAAKAKQERGLENEWATERKTRREKEAAKKEAFTRQRRIEDRKRLDQYGWRIHSILDKEAADVLAEMRRRYPPYDVFWWPSKIARPESAALDLPASAKPQVEAESMVENEFSEEMSEENADTVYTAQEQDTARSYVKGFDFLHPDVRANILSMLRSANENGVDSKLAKASAIVLANNPVTVMHFTSLEGTPAFCYRDEAGVVIMVDPNADPGAVIERILMEEFWHLVQKTAVGKSMEKKILVLEGEEALQEEARKYAGQWWGLQYASWRDVKGITEDTAETQEAFNQVYEPLPKEVLRDEAFANLMAEKGSTYKFFDRLVRGNRSLVLRAFSRIWGTVKALAKGNTAAHREANKLYKIFETALLRAQKYEIACAVMGSDAPEEAKEKASAAKTEELEQELAEMPEETGPDAEQIRHSLASISQTFFGRENVDLEEYESGAYKRTEGYKKYLGTVLDNLRQSDTGYNESSAKAYATKAIDGIVRVAVAMKKAGYDIADPGDRRELRDTKNRLLFSSLEPNSDYFTSSDISTICDKRINFTEIYEEIVRREEEAKVPENKRFFKNIDNYFYIHNVLADKGLTQPCRQCYVESMRKNLHPMASAFLRLVQETDEDNKKNDQLYNKNGEKKSNNAKLRAELLASPDVQEYDIKLQDLTFRMLTTADGLAKLKLQAPLIYQSFNSFYGQSKPKMPKAATPFRFGELTALLKDDRGNIKTGLIKQIRSTGGFRLQSYSDFQIKNFVDVLQVIFEAGTLGLNGHGYTKVPAFLDATKGTGLKRNISIFMYEDGGEWKIDRNDSFPMPLEKIYDLVAKDKTGDTGIVVVTQNEDHAAWVMANDKVGYFIPFQKSGMKMGTVRETVVKVGGREIKGYARIKDHTRQQSEVWARTTSEHKAFTRVKKAINIYDFWDFDNAEGLSKNALIEKNVKEYIDRCYEAGYIPKFREYLIDNGKFLKTVLHYAKQLGTVSQDATIDDISFVHRGYRIPYGYYKCLTDFSAIDPSGKASPIRNLSLANYSFEDAVQYFDNAQKLRREELLQQISNGEERESIRASDMTVDQIQSEIQRRRNQVVDEILPQTTIRHAMPTNPDAITDTRLTKEHVEAVRIATKQALENMGMETTVLSNTKGSTNVLSAAMKKFKAGQCGNRGKEKYSQDLAVAYLGLQYLTDPAARQQPQLFDMAVALSEAIRGGASHSSIRDEASRLLKMSRQYYELRENTIFTANKIKMELANKRKGAAKFFGDPGLEAMMKIIGKIARGKFLSPNDAREFAKIYQTFLQNNQAEIFGASGSNGYLPPNLLKTVQIINDSQDHKYFDFEQMSALNQAIHSVKNLYGEYHRVSVAGRKVELHDYAERAANNLEKVAEKATLNKNGGAEAKFFRAQIPWVTPRTVARRVDGYAEDGIITELFDDLRLSEDKATRLKQDWLRPFDKFIADHKGFDKRLLNETVSFRGDKLSLGQAISLFLTSKRQLAEDAIERSALKYKDKDGIEHTIKSPLEASGVKDASAADLQMLMLKAQKDISGLEKAFDQDVKEFIKIVEHFFNDVSTNAKTAADIKYYGWSNISEDYYFPILRTYIDRSAINEHLARANEIQNIYALSFNKATVFNSRPLMIQNVYDIVLHHADGLSKYVEMYEPLTAWDRIMNYNLGTQEAPRKVNDLMGQVWVGAEHYFRNMLTKPVQDVAHNWLSKIRSGAAQAALGMNIKTVISQFSGIISGARFLSVASLTYGIAHSKKFSLKTVPEIQQYSAAAAVRDYEYEGSTKVRSETNSERAKNWFSWTMGGINWADRTIINTLWHACLRQSSLESGKAIDSEENKIAAGKLLDKVIYETQSTYSSATRSQMQQSTSELAKALTMFSSDAVKYHSMLVDSFHEALVLKKTGADPARVKQAWSGFWRSFRTVLASQVTFVILGMLVNYGILGKELEKEEDETTSKALFDTFSANVGSSLLDVLPLVGDIVNAVYQGDVPEDIALSTITEALDIAHRGFDLVVDVATGKIVTGQAVARFAIGAAEGLGSYVGLPARNTKNLATGIVRRISPETYQQVYEIPLYGGAKQEMTAAVAEGNQAYAKNLIQDILENEVGKGSAALAKEMSKLYSDSYNANGYFKQIYRTIAKQITGEDGVTRDITRKEKEKILETYATAVDRAEGILSTATYRALDSAGRSKVLEKVFNAAYQEAWLVGTGQDNRDNAVKIQDLSGLGVEFYSILTASSALSATLKQTRKQRATQYMNGLGLSRYEKALILWAMGSRSEQDRKYLAAQIRKTGDANKIALAKSVGIIPVEK